jgi:hypothetical protein
MRLKQFILISALMLVSTMIPGKSVNASWCFSDATCGESQLGCYGQQVATACVYATRAYCCNSTESLCCDTIVYQCSPGVYCSSQLACPASLKCDTYGCTDCQFGEW